MKTVNVKGIEFGAGIPKIAVPIVGSSLHALLGELAAIKNLPVDLVEWRADYYGNECKPQELADAAAVIRDRISDLPFLFTFRNKREGGQKDISRSAYETLNKTLIQSGAIDLVDVELSIGEERAASTIETAHTHGVKVIMSSHDFQKTPSSATIIKRLQKMQELNADMTKIAVMPTTSSDVLTLLQATDQMKTIYADRPFITMSMSGTGVISRLTGELFGSALTFGSAKEASAPGQIDARHLNELLHFFHSQISQE